MWHSPAMTRRKPDQSGKPPVDVAFVRSSYEAQGPIAHYAQAVRTVGLWQSEEAWCRQYLPVDGYILDIGCGAGRTTVGLYRIGFYRLIGVDLSPRMIEAATAYARAEGLLIPFETGDAMNLRFADETFDGALFSFNGLMTIPTRANRIAALAEIRRTLKPGAHLIFTTHDRDIARRRFWRREERRWEDGEQDPRLHELGDMVFDQEGAETFIHIPRPSEIVESLQDAGLALVDTALRGEIATETQIVEEFSFGCRFWLAQRPE